MQVLKITMGMVVLLPTIALASWQVEEVASPVQSFFKAGYQLQQRVKQPVALPKETDRQIALPEEPFFQTGKEADRVIMVKSVAPELVSISDDEQSSLPKVVLYNAPYQESTDLADKTKLATMQVDSAHWQDETMTFLQQKEEHKAESKLQAYADSKRVSNTSPVVKRTVIKNQRFAISISGSLKDNISRIMEGYGWKVVWTVPTDYNYDGKVISNNLPNALEKLLKPFPLNAAMFLKNRVIVFAAE